MNKGFFLRGDWYYKLPDPFNITPYYPLDSHEIAKHLECSHRTALRICQEKRPLKNHELIYLQVLFFGLIHDPIFLRGKWFFRDGFLMSHNHDLSIDSNDAHAYAALRHNQHLLLAELTHAKQRIIELETKLGLIKTNVVNFADYRR